MKYYYEMFTNFLDFKGKCGVKQYWIATLYSIVFNILVQLLALPFIFDIDVFLSVSSSLASLYAIVIFIPSLSLTVRRLHDTDHSGWFLLISIFPIIGTIILLYVLCQPSMSQVKAYHTDYAKHEDDLYNQVYTQNSDVVKANKVESVNLENSADSINKAEENVVNEVPNQDNANTEVDVKNNSENDPLNVDKKINRATPRKKTRVEQIKECQKLLKDGKLTKEEYDNMVLKILSE